MTTQSETKEQTNNQQQQPQVLDRKAKIQKMIESASQFQEDTRLVIKPAANIPEIVLFPADFYLDFDDLIDEQVQIYHKSAVEAAEYAEKNFRVRRKLEKDATDPTREYARTIYKVTLPNTKFPDLVREFRITSKKGIEAINKELARVSMEHDGPILMTILMKMGSSKYKVDWEVSGQPYNKQTQ